MSPPVAVALSGGVDSLVSAALLAKEGREVFGVHFLTRASPAGEIDPLRRAAGLLGITLFVEDLTEAFERRVIAPFADEYAAGRTPNPCVMCNARIKFGVLLDRAKALGADFLATGHYARVEAGEGGARLFRGADSAKDQSYFLALVERERLASALFPLARLTKAEVRSMALRLGIAPLVKPESQDVCFVPDGGYRAFLEARGMAPKPGPVTDSAGRVLGMHRGLFAHTVGQRRGLGIPAAHPYYVLRLAPEENRLVVGREEELFSGSAAVSRVNWIIPAPERALRVSIRARHRGRLAPALLTPLGGGRVRLVFDNPVKAVTPGQAAVFYNGDEVLGGGVFE